MSVDPRIADIIVESLRSGEVPREGLEHFATGIDRHVAALDEEFSRIASGRGRYRFLRGEYGAGKTFFLRYLGARARAQGFAAAYVRIAYPEVPLHKPVALYRAICAGLGVHRKAEGGLHDVLDQWLMQLTERVADARNSAPACRRTIPTSPAPWKKKRAACWARWPTRRRRLPRR